MADSEDDRDETYYFSVEQLAELGKLFDLNKGTLLIFARATGIPYDGKDIQETIMIWETPVKDEEVDPNLLGDEDA